MMSLERPTTVTDLDAGPIEYRLERRGEGTVVVFHGGHMRAGLALGEDVFADLGYTVLVPSRPGYGHTPVGTGTSPDGFADVTAELCRHLGIDHVAAVVGISAGGRTAMAMAERHPGLTGRLILESSVGFLPWPARHTRVGANLIFGGRTERATWAAVRMLMRRAPALGLRSLLGDLSTRPADEVLAALTPEHRATLVALFSHMRSGHGFLNDLQTMGTGEPRITQPTLVIAAPKDGAVPFAHARSLAAGIPQAELLASDSNSHFIWFSEDYPLIMEKIRGFLTSR